MFIQETIVPDYQPGEIIVGLDAVPANAAPLSARLVYEMPSPNPGDPKMVQVLAAACKGIGPAPPPRVGWAVFFDGIAIAPYAPPGCVKAYVWTDW